MIEREENSFYFDEFRLDAYRRVLHRNGEQVALNSKSLDLLIYLVRNRNAVISKDELLEQVWPDQIVEENNLTVQISALRKALGETKDRHNFIATIPGKGYKFIAEVRSDAQDDILIEHRTIERITVEQTTERPQLGSGRRRLGFLVPVGIGVGLFALLVGGWFFVGSGSSPKKVQAMAVLPFSYQGERADADFLSDGITESLINNLSQLPNMTVKARSSVFHYKGRNVSPQTVGSELGVQAVMNGKIVEKGDDFALSFELINAATGDQIWGERFSRKRTEIATLSNEIARDVANKLRLKLSADPVARGQTKDSEAYELYLRGRFLWNKRRQADHERALELFEKAIARDPNFALAYSAVADVCTVESYKCPAGIDCQEKAQRYAFKALEIEPQLGEPYAALGNVEVSRFNWTKGDEYYLRSIELEPNYSEAHHWRAETLSRMRRHDEAIAEIKTALLIDPLSQVMNDDYAYILNFAGRYEEGVAQGRRSREMNAEWGTGHIFWGLEYLKRYDEALDTARDHPFDQSKDPEKIAAFNRTVERVRARYKNEGADGYWRGWLEFELAREKRDHYAIAVCYSEIGEPEKALDHLFKAVDVRNELISLIYAEPHFESLRSNPRWEVLVKRLGFYTN